MKSHIHLTPFRAWRLFLPLLVLFGCASGEYREYNVAMTPDASRAEALFRQGDYERAVPLYEQALADYRKAGNDTGILYCLEKLGWIMRETAEYGRALELFREAYPLGVRLNGDAAEIDADIGDVYQFSGDMEKARSHYEKCLHTLRDFVFKTKYARPPKPEETFEMTRKIKAIIHVRDMMGTLSYFEGDYEKALEHLKAAEELIERVLIVAEHPLYGMFFKPPHEMYEGMGFCYTMLGATYGEMKQYAVAWPYFDRGIDAFTIGQRKFGETVNRALRFKIEFQSGALEVDAAKLAECDRFMDEAERIGAIETVWRMSHILGREARARNMIPEARKYLARAIDTLELTRSRLREDSIKKMFAASVQEVYGDMIGLLFDTGEYTAGFDYLERAKARAFLDMLAGRSVREKEAVDTLLIQKEKELQHRIDMLLRRLTTAHGAEGEALARDYRRLLAERQNILETIKGQSLEFAATTTVATVPVGRIAGGLDPDTALISYFIGEKRSLVWVVARQRVTAQPVEMRKGELAELVADYREAIASRQDALFQDLGRVLHDTLIQPVRSALDGITQLYVVPSESLHYLPFSSLPAGENRYLVQDYVISLLPNASSLFYLDKAVARDKSSLFAMGNPSRGGDVPPLAYAEKEVRVISSEFKAARVLTGADARETVFRDNPLTGTGVVHIAAHGEYDTRFPLKSALLLAGDDQNDGNLETFEIFSLDMNPGLVVLSACESGVGRVEGGDEIQGLNRAFLYAGAGSVLASLWSVSDESTFRLMDYFYQDLTAASPAHALRQAQIRLMQTHPSPFYWAPFYLTGGMK